MTNDNVVPSTEREPESGYLPGAPGEPGSTANYPNIGTTDPSVADDAFALDDTAPTTATSTQTERAAAAAGGEPPAGSTRVGSGGQLGAQPDVDPVNSPYPRNDLREERDGDQWEHGKSSDSRVGGDGTAESLASTAKDAVDRGGQVADQAREEIVGLAGEFADQAKDLWRIAAAEVYDQLDGGQQRVAQLLHDWAAELGHLAARSEQDGPVTTLAAQAAESGGRLAHWLQTASPADVAAEVRRFARRRPMVFLAGTAVAGVLVGRLGRGMMADTSRTAAGRAALGGAR